MVIPFGCSCSVLCPKDNISSLLLPCQISLIFFCHTSGNIWVRDAQGSVDIWTCAIPPLMFSLLWQAMLWLINLLWQSKFLTEGWMWWMYKKQSFFPEDPPRMSLPWTSTWPFWRRTAAAESISCLAFLMAVLINTLPCCMSTVCGDFSWCQQRVQLQEGAYCW